MKHLEVLSLAKTKITSPGLKNIRGFKGLIVLNLSHCHIDGKGLAHLSGFQDLETLALEDTLVDGSGFIHLDRRPGFSTVKSKWLSPGATEAVSGVSRRSVYCRATNDFPCGYP